MFKGKKKMVTSSLSLLPPTGKSVSLPLSIEYELPLTQFEQYDDIMTFPSLAFPVTNSFGLGLW